MQTVKITHVVEGFTGGLVTYMAAILPELVCPGRSVTLIYSANRADPDCRSVIEKLRALGVRTIEIPFKRSIGVGDFYVFFKLLTLLKRGRFDVVHTHCAKAGFLGRFAAKIIGVKVICHSPHCFVSSRAPNSFKAMIYLWLEKIAALLTHKMVFVSDSEKIFAQKNKVVRSRQCEVISNGIVIEDDQPDERGGGGTFLKDEDFCVVFAGRLVGYKNPSLFIEAATLLRDDNIKFLICGDGPEYENLQRLINDNGLGQRVRLGGYIQDMAKVYRRANVFVMCSDAEGQPYALLEAMAHGCACVGVESDGITDILEHGQTGLICEKSVIGIAKAIEILIDEGGLRYKLSINAKRYVADSHSLQIQISSLKNLYDQMLLEKS